MSLTTPSSAPVVPAVNAGVVPVGFRPYSDITSFTYRTGMTHMALVENMRKWIQKTLIPFLNTNFTDMEDSWEIQVNALLAAVDEALTTQTADNTQKIADALTAISEADIQITDPAILAVLNDATTQARVWLDAQYAAKTVIDGLQGQVTELEAYYAPAPSGGDDTAVLQPLLLAAQATNGTLVLRKGTYLANLATVNSFQQPRIVGQGRDVTILKAYSNTAPVLRLKGGAGRLSGGFLADFAFDSAPAGGGVGLQLADAGGVRWTRLKFMGSFVDGIQALSESAGAFCEFNSGDAYFKNTVNTPLHYVRTLGNESFHGTGLTEGTVIERTATAVNPPVLIDATCFVYGAPLSATIFMSTPGMSAIRNLNPNRVASFHGHLDLEIASTGTNIAVGDPNQGTVFYQGTIGALQSASNLTMGRCFLVDKVYFIGTTVYATGRQTQQATPVTVNPQAIAPKSGTAVIQVDIRKGGQYHYSYLLHFWPNPYGAGGTVTVLANPSSINVLGYGPPVFSIVNGQLTVTNAAYPLDGTVIAFVTINNQNVTLATDAFNQS